MPKTSTVADKSEHPSTKQLLRSALQDLHAAEHLRLHLEHSDRQILKLIDDAAELTIKAVLLAEGLNVSRFSFPRLVDLCRTRKLLPTELDAMHRLRNRVKHGGDHAPIREVAAAYRAVVEFVKLVQGEHATGNAYCVRCKTKVPMFADQEFMFKGRRGSKRLEASWCFICNARTFRFPPMTG